MSGRARGYLVGAVVAAVAVVWIVSNLFPGVGLADLRGLLPSGSQEEARTPSTEPSGSVPETTAVPVAPEREATSPAPVPEETAAPTEKPAPPPEEPAPAETTGREEAASTADRESASATAANFVLTVWGYEGADVDEYWSRVQPLVTVAFYDPGGAEVEAGAGVAEAGGPSVEPAYVAESFEGFEVTDQRPDRVEGVASFISEETPAGERLAQEQDLALVRAESGAWLIDSASEIRTQPTEEEM